MDVYPKNYKTKLVRIVHLKKDSELYKTKSNYLKNKIKNLKRN